MQKRAIFYKKPLFLLQKKKAISVSSQKPPKMLFALFISANVVKTDDNITSICK